MNKSDLTKLIDEKLTALWGATGDSIEKQALIPPLDYKQAIICLSFCIEALDAIGCNETFHRLGGIDDCERCKALDEVRRIIEGGSEKEDANFELAMKAADEVLESQDRAFLRLRIAELEEQVAGMKLERPEVTALVDAVEAFNRPAWVFDDDWRRKPEAQALYQALNEYRQAVKER